MQQLFYQNAHYIFVAIGTIYGLAFYLTIPKGNSGVILTGIAVVLCFLFIAGRLIQHLYEKAYTDCLTGLRSRAGFSSLTEKRKKCSSKKTSLLMIDADNFKTINDRYGHQVGDDALKALAAIFHQTVRDNDSVFRWGGDEFVVILAEASLEDSTVIAERIRVAVETNAPYLLTVSIGVAEIINGNIGDALLVADKALYEAKTVKNAVAVNSKGQEKVILKTA